MLFFAANIRINSESALNSVHFLTKIALYSVHFVPIVQIATSMGWQYSHQKQDNQVNGFHIISSPMNMSSYFKCLIYKIILKVHKFVVHNLVNFVFYPNTADTEYNRFKFRK